MGLGDRVNMNPKGVIGKILLKPLGTDFWGDLYSVQGDNAVQWLEPESGIFVLGSKFGLICWTIFMVLFYITKINS